MNLSDKNPAVSDPVDLFDQVSERPLSVRFRRGRKKPRLRTGHFQGIQRLRSASDDVHYFAMTRSSWTGPFLIIVAFPNGHAQKGEIVAKHLLPSDGQHRPLKHPGGFQVTGDYAAIGVEDDRGKNRSQVQFWNLADPLDPQQATHLTIRREDRVIGNKTSGAVGICSRENDIYWSWGTGDRRNWTSTPRLGSRCPVERAHSPTSQPGTQSVYLTQRGKTSTGATTRV